MVELCIHLHKTLALSLSTVLLCPGKLLITFCVDRLVCFHCLKMAGSLLAP